jgi:HlyD family secretion protein
MKKRVVLTIFLVLLALVAAAIARNLSFGRNRLDTAVPVRSHTVVRGVLSDRVSGNGSFKADTAVGVGSQVSGEVQAVLVKEGDLVRKGDLLLKLKDGDYALNVEKLKAALDNARRGASQSLVTLRAQYRSARATLDDAQRLYGRNKELLASKAISEDSFQKSEQAQASAAVALQSAREQLNLRCGLPLSAEPPLSSEGDAGIIESSPEVEQALLNVRSAEDSVTRCVITAPMAGTVTQVKPSVGDTVAPSTPLVRIETLSSMLAEIQIDEVDIGKVHEGQAAEITSDSLLGARLSGTVVSIAPTITSLGSARASVVRVRIDPTALILRSGASCTARIVTSMKSDALTVPLSGFFAEEASTIAYVLEPLPAGKGARRTEVFRLVRREIKTGISDVNSVEVLSGLSEGERIAVGNLKLLRDGIYVTAKAE